MSNRRRFGYALGAAILALALGSGCVPAEPEEGVLEMGNECAASAECSGEGTCLKGICSGYRCESDDDCRADHVCGSVLGTRTCVVPCATDGQCGGHQRCVAVAEGIESYAAVSELCL